MEQVNEKQIRALKHFAKNPEIYRECLKGVRFDELGMKEAISLIARCRALENNNGDRRQRHIRFSQNYRRNDGAFATVHLTDRELSELRQAHRQHCQSILEECLDDYQENFEILSMIFEKRCDKIFTWIQQALDEKVRNARESSVPDGQGGPR